VFRLLLKISTALSLSFFALMVIAFVIAHWVSFMLSWGGSRYCVVLVPLRIGLLIAAHPPFDNGPHSGFDFQWHSADWAHETRDDVLFYDTEFEDQMNVAFGPRVGLYYRGSTLLGLLRSTHHAIIPYWLALVAMLVAPAVACWARLRPGYRRRRGRCTKCGYDLQATPNRCPECGLESTPPNRACDPRFKTNRAEIRPRGYDARSP
jgi:hypothetical protein